MSPLSFRSTLRVMVHLIDGTYELFRHFYGLRRFNKGKDKPFGAVVGVLNGVLQMIEDDAKSRNDLTVANKAHFLHLELASRHLRGLPRLWDVVVYRWVFGYLVRPLYPLLWLVGLVVVVSAWRKVSTWLRKSARLVGYVSRTCSSASWWNPAAANASHVSLTEG